MLAEWKLNAVGKHRYVEETRTEFKIWGVSITSTAKLKKRIIQRTGDKVFMSNEYCAVDQMLRMRNI